MGVCKSKIDVKQSLQIDNILANIIKISDDVRNLYKNQITLADSIKENREDIIKIIENHIGQLTDRFVMALMNKKYENQLKGTHLEVRESISI